MGPFVLATLPACTSSQPSWVASWARAAWARTTRSCSWWPRTWGPPRRAARAKWGGDGRAHVDALTRLDMIDGYAVGLERAGAGDATETEGYN